MIQEFRPVSMGVQIGLLGCRFWDLLLLKKTKQNTPPKLDPWFALILIQN